MPEFDLGSDTIVCKGETFYLECNIQNVECKWQDGSTGKTFEVKNGGEYFLDVWDANGCHYADSINIGFFSDIDFVDIDTIICAGIPIVWNGQLIENEGDYEYHHDNMHGCDSTTILHVMYFPVQDVGLEDTKYLCKGRSTIINAGVFEEYIWNTGDTTAILEVSEPGMYKLTVTDDHGCKFFDSVAVIIAPKMEIQYNALAETCYGYNDGSINIKQVSGGKGEVKLYFGEKIITSTRIIRDLQPGIYELRAIDSLGCEKTEQIKIDSAERISVDLGQDIVITSFDTLVHLFANNNIDNYSQIEWYVNGELQEVQDEDIDITIDDNKEIRVVIYDENGCEAMDTLLIIVDFKVNIYVPNIFTPDGDGINDIWRLGFKGYKPDILEGAIYNRWGEKIIFWSDNDNIEWDGTFKGKRVSPGVYVYYIKYRTSQGKDSVLTGDITVIR